MRAVILERRHAPAGELEVYLLERNPGGGPLLAQSLARLFRQAGFDHVEYQRLGLGTVAIHVATAGQHTPVNTARDSARSPKG